MYPIVYYYETRLRHTLQRFGSFPEKFKKKGGGGGGGGWGGGGGEGGGGGGGGCWGGGGGGGCCLWVWGLFLWLWGFFCCFGGMNYNREIYEDVIVRDIFVWYGIGD
jgi:hypothetical protein